MWRRDGEDDKRNEAERKGEKARTRKTYLSVQTRYPTCNNSKCAIARSPITYFIGNGCLFLVQQ